MSVFGYSDQIVGDFPRVRGGVIRVTRLTNRHTPSALIEIYEAEQRQVRGQIGETPLSQIPSLGAWRRAFSAFGVKPTQYRSAAEALLRRLMKQGDIPSINLAVDIANMVSIRHRLPVAAFDQREVSGGTTVRYAEGSERFTDLGTAEITHPDLGEVIFVDETGLVSARRWCWRQGNQSATHLDTTEVLYTIEGQHETADEDVGAATEDMVALINEYLPDSAISWAILSPSQRVFG